MRIIIRKIPWWYIQIHWHITEDNIYVSTKLERLTYDEFEKRYWRIILDEAISKKDFYEEIIEDGRL